MFNLRHGPAPAKYLKCAGPYSKPFLRNPNPDPDYFGKLLENEYALKNTCELPTIMLKPGQVVSTSLCSPTVVTCVPVRTLVPKPIEKVAALEQKLSLIHI